MVILSGVIPLMVISLTVTPLVEDPLMEIPVVEIPLEIPWVVVLSVVIPLVTGYSKKSVSRTVHLFFVGNFCCIIPSRYTNND